VKITLHYGKTGLICSLPDNLVEKVLKTSGPKPLAKPSAAILSALKKPYGNVKSLGDAAKGAGSVCIVISDVTRPVPYPVLLPPLLETLEKDAKVARKNISLLIATGLHRPNVGAELSAMVGKNVADNYAILNHDARDRASHVEVGVTSRGTHILVDKRYVAADFKIVTGLVEPHFMAGYSGGRKAICPGISSAETIGKLHSAELLGSDGAELGRIDGNPMHAEILEGALLAGVDYCVNVTVNAGRKITGVFAGDIHAAHLAACAAAEKAVSDHVDRPVDIVLTTGAGYPLDATFYQTVKGMVGAASIVKPGGTIIIVSECSEGMGSKEFTAQVRDFGSPDAFLKKIYTSPGFVIDQWQLQLLAKVLKKAQVLLVSTGVKASDIAPLDISVFADVESALNAAISKHGKSARVAVIPEGPYVLASCKQCH
jgi:nickel-dependent lactate racemase